MPAITSEENGEILVVGFTDSKILDNQRIEQVGKELQEVVAQAIHKKLIAELPWRVLHVVSDDHQVGDAE